MVTRRAMLKGTAAGSIAAIASAHGVAASAARPDTPAPPGPVPIPYPNVLGAGYGNLAGGALAGFLKLSDSFSLFIKWHFTAAELFYKEDVATQAVNVFFKYFDKARGWGHFVKIDSLEGLTLQGADASFFKVQADSAGIFLKFPDEFVDIRNVYADVDVCEPNTLGCEGTID